MQEIIAYEMSFQEEIEYGNEMILHVAEWNQNAIKLYLETGFTIQKKERIH